VIPVNRHRIWQLVADGCLIALAWWLAFELRFDHGVPIYYDKLFQQTILIVVAIQLVVFVLFRFYDRWWRYVSIRDMWSALRYLGWQAGSLPETEKASAENLALPMWAGIPAETQERVVSVIREAAGVRA
jgi:hypothetical protein